MIKYLYIYVFLGVHFPAIASLLAKRVAIGNRNSAFSFAASGTAVGYKLYLLHKLVFNLQQSLSIKVWCNEFLKMECCFFGTFNRVLCFIHIFILYVFEENCCETKGNFYLQDVKFTFW